ncbi:MAG: GPP34 family phosphoprotein [Thermoflexales bacterium]|nr:GPP34 family phosphoprotein [Thermoflexales bacterium]
MLTLHEELMLLALDDKEGVVVPHAREPLKMGLASAILTELTLRGKLQTDAQFNVVVVNPTPTGDPLLDRALEAIRSSAPSPQPATFWIENLARDMRDLEDQVIRQLVQRGALRAEESRRLLFFKESRFPQGVSGFEEGIRRRLRDVVIGGASPDERTLALIGLIKMTNLIEVVFPYTEWEQARRRIEELTSPQAVGWPTAMQPGYAPQPEPVTDMLGSVIPVLMFSMLAQSMFWGAGGWMLPGMLSEPLPEASPLDEGGLLEAGGMDDSGDIGFDFGDFGGEF